MAHSLTTTPAALELATVLTLKEFEDDGVCYIELRSTPRETAHMSRRQYIDAIIQAMKQVFLSYFIFKNLIIIYGSHLSIYIMIPYELIINFYFTVIDN